MKEFTTEIKINGAIIKRLRTSNGVSVAAAAALMNVTPRGYYNIENGRFDVTLTKAARFLNGIGYKLEIAPIIDPAGSSRAIENIETGVQLLPNEEEEI